MSAELSGLRGWLLVLVPHEPTLDPRVHYTSESLAKRYAVTVLATVQEAERRPHENRPRHAAYATVRIPYRNGLGAVRMGLSFIGLWLSQRHQASNAQRVIAMLRRCGTLGTLLGPVLAAFLSVAALGVGLSGFRAALSVAKRIMRPVIIVSPGTRSTRWRVWLRDLAKATGRTADRFVAASELVVSGPRMTFSVFRFMLQANALLWRQVLGTDRVAEVVYCHDLYSLQAGVMLRRRCGARLVYDSHEYYPYQYVSRCFTRVIRAYEAVLVREVDVYITVSPQLAAELERVYSVRSVHAIPNIEPVPNPRPPVVASEMSALANGRLKLLYQGTFAEGRGLEEVLRECEGMDGMRVALFLRGPRNPCLEQLERLADELGLLGKSVYVLPPVLEKDLIGAAQEADIGLVPYKGDRPSYRFACPNKLSQYLHAGLAILANRIPYVVQLVDQGQVGLCYNVDELGSFARAVEALASDRSGVERFRRNALVFARGEYSWERYEDVLLSLVESR